VTLCDCCGRRPAEHRSSDDALAAVSDEHLGVCSKCLDEMRDDRDDDCARRDWVFNIYRAIDAEDAAERCRP
jgi:hypothetical protein